MDRKKLGIYVHIPFCVKKCDYCDFLSAPAEKEVQERYMERLMQDITAMKNKDSYEADTVFFGGGTPSIVNAEWIAKVMETLQKEFAFSQEAEVSIEANPGTVTRESLEIYKKCGINRISFGLQSMDDRELELLGRIHRKKDFIQAFYSAREAGFSNINVDLMSALPGQTVKSCLDTLRQTAALRPEHISAYSLIIEEGTPFYERYREDECLREQGKLPRLLPDEEAERRMYELTEEILSECGYERYEISNYAIKGFECRHNLKYWERKEYAGFGIGASSLLGNCRFKKTDSLNEYLGGFFDKTDVEILTEEDEMAEFMYLGLRKTSGIRCGDFKDSFSKRPEEVYGSVLEKFQKEKLIIRTTDGYMLTKQGLNVCNRIFAEFI